MNNIRQKGFTCILWNLRSFSTRLGDFDQPIGDTKPDIVCLCETRLDPLDRIRVTGYNGVHKARNTHGGYVSCLVKQGIDYYIPDIPDLQNICDIDGLGFTAVKIRLCNSMNVHFFLFYVSPTCRANDFDFWSFVLTKCLNFQPCVVLGDFNAHAACSNFNARGRAIERCGRAWFGMPQWFFSNLVLCGSCSVERSGSYLCVLLVEYLFHFWNKGLHVREWSLPFDLWGSIQFVLAQIS